VRGLLRDKEKGVNDMIKKSALEKTKRGMKGGNKPGVKKSKRKK
jgi:hypothetical protein